MVNYNKYGLDEALTEYMLDLGKQLQVELKKKHHASIFIELIEKLSKEDQVVILIDEYDKQIIDYLTHLEIAEKNKDILKNFYSGIKGSDEYIKFSLITGVSKFSKVSIFSDLNNLYDITIDKNYSTMLGYTENEIFEYFEDYIKLVIEDLNLSREEFTKRIKDKYNRYSWDGRHFVYNPFSILALFKQLDFRNFWFASGTPTFLIKMTKEKNIELHRIEDLNVTDNFFNKFELSNIDIYSLMFQIGYLTIKSIDEFETYNLSYPNNEVRESYLFSLMEEYSYNQIGGFSEYVINIRKAFMQDNIELFIERINSLFASIPYNIFLKEQEKYYHSIIYIALKILGVHIHCEVETNKGRIDALVKTEDFNFVIEFKLGTAKEAMDQIKEREYYKQFLNDKRKVKLIGIGFNVEAKGVGDFLQLGIGN